MAIRPPRKTSIHSLGLFDSSAASSQSRDCRKTHALVSHAHSNIEHLKTLLPSQPNALLSDCLAMELELYSNPHQPGLQSEINERDHARHLAAISDAAFLAWINDIDDIGTKLSPPSPSKDEQSSLTFECIVLDTLPNAKSLMGDIIERCLKWSGFGHPGANIAEHIKHNLLTLSSLSEHEASRNPSRLIWPSDTKLTAAEAANAYFANTPFLPLLTAKSQISIPTKTLYEHTHICAAIGHGKTQLLQHIIVSLLQRPKHQVPGMVILDSHGDMIETIQRLALLDPTIENSLADRLLIVDPSDVEFAPHLNMFDLHSHRMEGMSLKDREQTRNGVISIFDYIFGGLLGMELSPKMKTLFRAVVDLMMVIPDATILTLLEVFEDFAPFEQYTQRLAPLQKKFFDEQYHSKSYNATREQIIQRLYGFLNNPSFARMFATPRNRLDLYPILNDGGIVLVNTNKQFLNEEGAAMLGRYIIALSFKAALERAGQSEDDRRETYLIIDEASDYFSDRIDELLRQVRKYRMGLVMAHQHLGQLKSDLQASTISNTSVKFMGGLSDKDARIMAAEMRVTPQFLSEITKDDKATHFALYARGTNQPAIDVRIPFGTAEKLPKMPKAHFEILRNKSRKRLSPKTVEPDNKSNQVVEDPPHQSEDDEFWHFY